MHGCNIHTAGWLLAISIDHENLSYLYG